MPEKKSLLLMLLSAAIGCAPGFRANRTTDASSVLGAKLDGAKIYAENCSTCHGAIAVSTKTGRSPQQILQAVNTIPRMSHLQNLIGPSQADAIAMAVNSDGGVACAVSSAGTTALRRLTTQELQNALVDLLGINQNFTAGVDPDISGESGFQNDAKSLTIGYLRLAKIVTAVETAVAAALNAAGSPFLSCPNGIQNAACAASQLNQFARRAYRRDLSSDETASLAAVYNANASAGFKTALGLGMQKILLSPHFMHLTTFTGGSSAAGKLLSEFEFAARLSLLLWNSVPDTQLLDLASSKALRQPETLKAQIRRMLADPKSDRFIASFFGQWLKYTDIADKARIVRTGLSDSLRNDMLTETHTFLKSIVTEDASLMKLVTADYSYINSNLASHYGLPAVAGASFVRTPLSGAGRRGVLSHAAILTLFSNGVESRPVARGKFLLEDILCEPPGAPPPETNTGALDPANLGGLTVRQQMAVHAANPQCASCHSQIDPLGLALENFNQIGKFRRLYSGGQTVDASGSILNEKFSDYLGLSGILARQNKVRGCLARKVLTYALWRTAGENERCAAKNLAALAVQDGSRFSDLIYQVVTHEMFNLNVTDSR